MTKKDALAIEIRAASMFSCQEAGVINIRTGQPDVCTCYVEGTKLRPELEAQAEFLYGVMNGFSDEV